VSVQLESSVALALPVECVFPHASTHDASAQPYAHARNTLHSLPRAHAFFASLHLSVTHVAHRSALAGSGAAVASGAPASPASVDASSVPASDGPPLHDEPADVFGAPFAQVEEQSVEHFAHVRASLHAANAA
jgi:hypothetical protein